MNKQSKKKCSVGFSLIEVVISMAIIGLIIPAMASILMTVLRQQLVINQLSMMKREGDAMAKIIKAEIQQQPVQIYNHTTMTPQSGNLRCHPSRTPEQYIATLANPIYLLRRDGQYLTFQVNTVNGVNILQRNVQGTLVNVHNHLIQVVSMRTECLTTSQYGSPLLSITFTLAPRIQSLDPNLAKQLHYQIRVKASSY